MLYTVILCAFLVSAIRVAVGLDCYTCTNATTAADCKQTTTCPSGYVCKKEYTILGASMYYTLGCVQESSCPANSSIHHSVTETSSLVGRSAQARSMSHCTDCCRTNNCNLQLCQEDLHGGWTQWSAWSSCSSSCDIGMQRRDRTCTNPYPSRYGDHCSGDTRDDRLCYPGACADGGWSSWNTWSSCSSSCGNGLQMRSRTCNNPPPSLVGRFCLGKPSETAMCHTKSCPEKVSAFSVTGASSSGFPLHFGTVKVNIGNDYSTNTNKFTCRIPGLYFFTADLTKARSSTRIDMVSAYIDKNGYIILQIKTDPTDDDTDKGSYEATGSIILHLVAGDRVSVHISSGTVETWSTFSGFLISPDP